MKLTPLDIQQQQFRSVLWGMDAKEVDAFLDLVAREVERLNRENSQLSEEVARKDAQIQGYREREQTLKETMMTATRVTEEMHQNAKKEAEVVIARAENQAEQIVENAHRRLVRVMEDLDELKRQKAQFEANLRSLIESHSKLLEAMADRQQGSGELGARGTVVPLPDPVRRVEVSDDDLLTPRGGDR